MGLNLLNTLIHSWASLKVSMTSNFCNKYKCIFGNNIDNKLQKINKTFTQLRWIVEVFACEQEDMSKRNVWLWTSYVSTIETWSVRVQIMLFQQRPRSSPLRSLRLSFWLSKFKRSYACYVTKYVKSCVFAKFHMKMFSLTFHWFEGYACDRHFKGPDSLPSTNISQTIQKDSLTFPRHKGHFPFTFFFFLQYIVNNLSQIFVVFM